ncbi:MAG: hypothetical protein OQK77_00445 [Psychromonas sp.]|nr:hypothetical protein [Psychromonas sp.]
MFVLDKYVNIVYIISMLTNGGLIMKYNYTLTKKQAAPHFAHLKPGDNARTAVITLCKSLRKTPRDSKRVFAFVVKRLIEFKWVGSGVTETATFSETGFDDVTDLMGEV